MPAVIPTREEAAHLPWYQRQKVRATAIAALREWVADAPEPEDFDAVKVDFGRQVRDDARTLALRTPPDPQASEHRAALLAALNEVSA